MWLALSGLFALYTSFSNSYTKTYGTLAGGIILLLWLNYSAWAILFGAELNAQLDRQAESSRDASTRADQADRRLGRRGVRPQTCLVRTCPDGSAERYWTRYGSSDEGTPIASPTNCAYLTQPGATTAEEIEHSVDGEKLRHAVEPDRRLVAAPRPFVRPSCPTRSNGIEHDVARELEHVRLAERDPRPEAALEERSFAADNGVEPLGVLAFQVLHPDREVRVRRVEHQVEVVPHQAVGVNLPDELSDDLREQAEEVLAITVSAVEDRRFSTPREPTWYRTSGASRRRLACHCLRR